MTLTVSNRDLLRRYRELKDKLLSGDIDEVIVTQKHDVVIKLYVERKLSPFQRLVEMVKKKPILNVRRTDQDIF